MNVPVAQLDRVSASDAEGRGFESLRVRQVKNNSSLEPKVRSQASKFVSVKEFPLLIKMLQRACR